MRLLITRIDAPTVLLWVADHRAGTVANRLDGDPLLVTEAMMAAVAARATARLDVVISDDARAARLDGMAFAPLDRLAAEGVPGPLAHREVADRLAAVVATLV